MIQRIYPGLGLLILLTACSPKDPSSSELHGSLMENPLKCTDYSDEQYAQLEAQLDYAKMFHNFNDPTHKKRLLKHLYGVPQRYRDIMIDQNDSGRFKGFFHESISGTGLCQFSDSGPTRISLSNSFAQSIEFSMIHESGHGMTFIAAKDAGMSYNAFNNKIAELMNEGVAYNKSRGSNDPKIRAYALSQQSEYWADTFSDYYCSPKTHEFIKTKLPKNYAFVSTFLEPPVWATSSDPVIPESKAKDFALSLAQLFIERTPSCTIELKSLALGDKSSQASFSVGLKSKEDRMSMDLTFDATNNLSSELAKLRFQVDTLKIGCGQ